MISAIFTTELHPEYGTMGFRMRGRPHFEPIGGMGVAHDLLEHFPNDGGDLEGELMALGASLYVRNMDEYYANKGVHDTDPASHISSEFVQQCHLLGDAYTLRAINTRPLRDEYVESCIQNIVTRGRRLVHADVGAFPVWLKTGHKAALVGWLRAGYRAAAQRYRRHKQYNVLHAFVTIEHKVDAVLRYAEEGYEYRVAADLSCGRVLVTELGTEW